jgi:hypothetical protein
VSPFPCHLWKEWRDHRAVILGIVALLPPVIFAAMLLIPEGAVALPTAGAAAALAAVALALGSDLVPGEIRRGTILFLRRLPGGLGPIFLAKAVLLLGSLVLSGALGFGAANLAQKVAGRPSLSLDWSYAPEAFTAVLWIFAVAMWLPRGELAVPATALCLGAFVLPMHLLLEANPGLNLPVSAMSVGRWALVPAAILVAWLSFRGRRFGGAWGSAWRGLLVTLVLFAPAWGYVGQKVSDWRHFDLSDPAFRIDEAFLGAGERYAFLNARCGGPSHAVILDLTSGEWRRVGAPGDHFWPLRGAGVYAVLELETQLRPETPAQKAALGVRGHWSHYFDATSGEEFKSGWSFMRHEEVERRLAAPLPCDNRHLEIRAGRRLVLVRGGSEEQLFPR